MITNLGRSPKLGCPGLWLIDWLIDYIQMGTPLLFQKVGLASHSPKPQTSNHILGLSVMASPHSKPMYVYGATLSHLFSINYQVWSHHELQRYFYHLGNSKCLKVTTPEVKTKARPPYYNEQYVIYSWSQTFFIL